MDRLLKHVTWTDSEAQAFDEIIRRQRTIDEDDWR
jgi:hypothetical protein